MSLVKYQEESFAIIDLEIKKKVHFSVLNEIENRII